MSIQSPVGTLDIKNATLRVGRLEVSNIQGIDTALNVTRSNAVLIYDDQASTTTFSGFTSTPGVRDTVNGYLDLAGGYVYWGQKLPNYWVMEFEMDIRSGTNAGPLYANIFSTTNTGGNGYSFTFNDSNDKITLKYDGTTLTETTVSGLFTASEDWQKVVINYERGLIAISLDGNRKFYYKDIERETPYVNGEYVNFSSASTDGRKIRNLKITNGSKWIYSGESNVIYNQGSVGIGVSDPTTTLDVGGTVKAVTFAGDGSAITNISSTNIGDFASNVTRIANLETSNGYIWSNLTSNATRITNLETSNSHIWSNLSSNATRITNLESGNITISGQKTFSEEIIFQSNIHVRGDLLVANTVNMVVSDPIIELGSNNLNTGDLGIVMTRHGASNSNVAIVYDESVDALRMGYTLGGANDTTIELDSNLLAVNIQGNLEVGTANLFVNTTTSNVGIRTSTPAYTLDVDGDINFSGSFYQGGSPFVSSEWTTGASSLYYRSNVEVGTANLFVDTVNSRVGVGTTTPEVNFQVAGNSRFDVDVTNADHVIVGNRYSSGDSLSLVSAGSININMDSNNNETDRSIDFRTNTLSNGGSLLMRILEGGNVGIGMASPLQTLHVKGNGLNPVIYMSDATNNRYSSGMGTHNVTNVGQRLDFYNGDSGANGTSLTSSHIRMSIDASGNVGIGTTGPSQKLHVAGNAKIDGPSTYLNWADTQRLIMNFDNNYRQGFHFSAAERILKLFSTSGDTGGAITFNTRTSAGTSDTDYGAERMRITGGGLVGIGTSSPSATLHVNGSIYSPGVICQTQQYDYSSTGSVVISSGSLTVLTCSFTPKFSNSKILFEVSCPVQSSSTYFNIFVKRAGTKITSTPGNYGIISYNSGTNLNGHFMHTGIGYDLPATTSAINYDIVAEYGSGASLILLTQAGKLMVFIHEVCQ